MIIDLIDEIEENGIVYNVYLPACYYIIGMHRFEINVLIIFLKLLRYFCKL